MYEDIWEATIGGKLPCRRELNNRQHPFAVAVPGCQIVVGVIACGWNFTDKLISCFCKNHEKRRIYIPVKFFALQ